MLNGCMTLKDYQRVKCRSQNQAVKHRSHTHQDTLAWVLACSSPSTLFRNSLIHWQLVNIQTELCPKGLTVWLNMAQHLRPLASQAWRAHSEELPSARLKEIIIQPSTTTILLIFLYYNPCISKTIKNVLGTIMNAFAYSEIEI